MELSGLRLPLPPRAGPTTTFLPLKCENQLLFPDKFQVARGVDKPDVDEAGAIINDLAVLTLVVGYALVTVGLVVGA